MRITIPMRVARITSGGQISLPAAIRRRWGTARVAIEDEGDRVVLRPIPDDPIDAAYGAFEGRIGPTEELRHIARREEAEAERRRR